MDTHQKILNKNLNTHLELLLKNRAYIKKEVIRLSNLIYDCFNNGGKILIAGNGGSAADAQHFSTELTVRLKYNRVALPAIALTTDTSAITAIGNDFKFEKIFSRQIEALAKKDDIFIPISTSGNSKNILEALKISNKRKVNCYAILGGTGGKAKKLSQNKLIIKSNSPSRVQEIHIIFWQNVCELVENKFRKKKKIV